MRPKRKEEKMRKKDKKITFLLSFFLLSYPFYLYSHRYARTKDKEQPLERILQPAVVPCKQESNRSGSKFLESG